MKGVEIKSFLDDKAFEYESPSFINEDPIQIPHKFSKKEDIEISGFLTAIISWGNRKMIIKNGNSLMNLMDNSPFDFVLNHNKNDLNTLNQFVHRTFNSEDLCFFIKSLNNIYKYKGGLEHVFNINKESKNLNQVIHNFKNIFFSITHQKRTEKHIAKQKRKLIQNGFPVVSVILGICSLLGVPLATWIWNGSQGRLRRRK